MLIPFCPNSRPHPRDCIDVREHWYDLELTKLVDVLSNCQVKMALNKIYDPREGLSLELIDSGRIYVREHDDDQELEHL
jgi:hypothetical protein